MYNSAATTSATGATATGFEQSTMQLVVDQLEELIVTLIEEIRERPGVAGAILAAIVGAGLGSMFALRARRRSGPPRISSSTRGLVEMVELAGLAIKLLQNPIVRGYLRSMLRKRLAF
jgi:hypothetical protein